MYAGHKTAGPLFGSGGRRCAGGTGRRAFGRRRGTTAVLAMLYLVLFSTLSVGFYASVNTSVQIAGNEQRGVQARLAAESGMEFMKLQLATLGIPAGTQGSELFDQAYARLQYKLDGYPNMGGASVELSSDGNYIYVPGGTDNWITADAQGGRFRAVLEKQNGGQQIQVKVVGRYGGTDNNARALQLKYAVAQNASAIFNYGVASKSAISMNGNVSITGGTDSRLGSVLSATTSTPIGLTMTGSAVISGDVSFVRADAMPSISSNSTIAGYRPSSSNFASHVHKNVAPPEFPTVDTTDFAAFVPDESATGSSVITATSTLQSTYTNVRIKANANPNFTGGVTLRGVVYVETPNKVTFGGNVNLQGVVVVETDGDNNASLSPTENTIDFNGGVNVTGVETLPESSEFPAELRAMTGSMLLAPGFNVGFGGNFNTVNGSIIASQLNFYGTAGGTIKGTVVNLNDTALTLSGTSDIVIESRGTTNYPAGVYFGSHYSPLPDTYAEVTP